MKNQLPQNWKGMFFEEEEANKILNITAEEFANSLLENNSDDAKFFLAGAISDFEWHGLSDKAKKLIEVASKTFEEPYELIPEFIVNGKKQIGSDLNEEEAKSMFYKFIGEMFKDRKGSFGLDLRVCNVGMSCGEYTTLIIAGPSGKDLPDFVRELMIKHKKACPYHQSEGFHRSVISTPVTRELEQATNKIIEKYSE